MTAHDTHTTPSAQVEHFIKARTHRSLVGGPGGTLADESGMAAAAAAVEAAAAAARAAPPPPPRRLLALQLALTCAAHRYVCVARSSRVWVRKGRPS